MVLVWWIQQEIDLLKVSLYVFFAMHRSSHRNIIELLAPYFLVNYHRLVPISCCCSIFTSTILYICSAPVSILLCMLYQCLDRSFVVAENPIKMILVLGYP
jgi:hypothetical protein